MQGCNISRITNKSTLRVNICCQQLSTASWNRSKGPRELRFFKAGGDIRTRGVEEEEAALMCMKQSGINVLLISSSLYEDAHRMGTYIGLAFAPFKDLKIA